MLNLARNPNHHRPRQMPHSRHHDPHIKRKLISTALREEVPFEEHAGPLAELNDGAGHALGAERKMRRGVERDGIEVSDMADLMRALGTGVLAGHDIAAQIDGDGVFAIHPTFLTQRLDRPAAYNGFVKFVDALPEAKGVWILDQGLEDRPGQAVQLCRLNPRQKCCAMRK